MRTLEQRDQLASVEVRPGHEFSEARVAGGELCNQRGQYMAAERRCRGNAQASL